MRTHVGEPMRAMSLAINILACLVCPSIGLAQNAEADFYRGKTIRMIVGYGPGGGYDSYARMIAPYIGRELGASVIVENQPGAGGLTALDRLYSTEPDGLKIQIVNAQGAALAQMAASSAARYDLAKVGHLGTVSASPWMWMTNRTSSFKTPDQIPKTSRPMVWGGTSPIDGASDGAAFTCEALRLNCKIVIGYPGSNEIAAAVAKNEMDAQYVSDGSGKNYIKANPELRMIAVMGRKRSRFFPDIPAIFDIAKLNDEQAWLIDFHAAVEDLGRLFVTTPNVPEARLAVLRAAVERAMKTPALIEEGERTERYIEFVDAKKTQETAVKVVSGITPAQKTLVNAIIDRAQSK